MGKTGCNSSCNIHCIGSERAGIACHEQANWKYAVRKLEEKYDWLSLPMSPKRPRILPKTSTTRIFTKRSGSAASEIAAVEPVIPTQTPQRRLQTPTVRPPQNNAKPAIIEHIKSLKLPNAPVKKLLRVWRNSSGTC